MENERPLVHSRDEQLIRSIRLGGNHQERALSEINRDPRATRAVRRMVFDNGGRDGSDVKSTFNQGLMALTRKIHRLEEEDIALFKLWAYLLVACRYCWYKEHKKRLRLLKQMASFFENMLPGKDRGNRYLTIKDKQRLEDVEALIDELPEDDRLLLLMHELGYTYAEVGDALGLSMTAAKTRAHRLKKRLLNELNDRFPDLA